MNQYLEKLREYAVKEFDEDFTAFHQLIAEGRSLTLAQMLEVLDCFIFEFKDTKTGKTPLEIYLEKDLPSEERTAVSAFKQGFYSLFQVDAIKTGKEMRLKDLIRGKEYQIQEKVATNSLQKGNIFFTRLLPVEEHFIITSIQSCFSELQKDNIIGFYKELLNHPDSKENHVLGVVAALIDISKNGSNWQALTDDSEKKALEIFSKFGVSEATFVEMLHMIRQPRSKLQDIVKFVFGRASFKTREEADQLMKVIMDVWNKVPHNELGGKSPEQFSANDPRGPKETAIMLELLDYLKQELKSGLPSQKPQDKTFNEIQDKWLDTPQGKLSGKTPRQTIMEERQSLGVDSVKIGLSLELTAIPMPVPGVKKEFMRMNEEGIKFMRSGDFESALEKYKKLSEIDPDNYIVWGQLGIIYGLLINREESERCLRKALELKPDYEKAKNNLALLLNSSDTDLRRIAKQMEDSGMF